MSSMEQTLSIIKPDAVERNLDNEIKEMFKNKGFKIISEKKIQIEKAEAEKKRQAEEAKEKRKEKKRKTKNTPKSFIYKYLHANSHKENLSPYVPTT